jgi:hypothetical protein
MTYVSIRRGGPNEPGHLDYRPHEKNCYQNRPENLDGSFTLHGYSIYGNAMDKNAVTR